MLCRLVLCLLCDVICPKHIIVTGRPFHNEYTITCPSKPWLRGPVHSHNHSTNINFRQEFRLLSLYENRRTSCMFNVINTDSFLRQSVVTCVFQLELY